MKIQFKYFSAIFGAALCLVIPSACERQEADAPGNERADIIVSVDRAVTQIGADARTRTSLSGLTPSWSNSDSIKVFDTDGYSAVYKYSSNNGDGTYSFTCVSADDDFVIGNFAAAYYPASGATGYSGGTITANIPSTQTYTAGTFADGFAPMVSNSRSLTGNGTMRIYFTNAFCVVKIPMFTNTGKSVSSVTLTSWDSNYMLSGNGASVTFTGTEANKVDVSYLSGGSASVTLSAATAVALNSSFASDPTCFYIPVPAPAAGTSPFVQVSVNTGAETEDFTFQMSTASAASLNYAAQNYVAQLPKTVVGYSKLTTSDVLPGVFSVGRGEYVQFSKGNLQATCTGAGVPGASTYSWGFAANQYDMVGDNPGNTTIDSQTVNAKVDLFGWSTASTYYGISTSVSEDDYSGAFVDWGNIPTLPGNSGSSKIWFTPSIYMWKYLIDARTGNQAPEIGTQTDARYAEVKVNGVPGLLLFPDVFTWPSSVTNVPGTFNEGSSDWNSIDYTTGDFSQLESAGCVFLPVAGSRSASTVDVDGSGDLDSGIYYSSTPVTWWDREDGVLTELDCVCALLINNTFIESRDDYLPSSGRSVRLVTIVQ